MSYKSVQRRRSQACGWVLGWLLSVMAPLTAAHHGWRPHYDGNAHLTITGVITRFEFVNPHSFVYLDVANEAGETESWWCEMQSRTQLERRGAGIEQFEIGSTITIDGFLARRDPRGCEFGTGQFDDGTVLTLRERDGRAVYRAPLTEGDTSIVGTWYPETFLAEAGSEQDSQFELTPQGEAAHETFDWLNQNPTLSCSPASNIRAWAAPGLPTRIEREGTEIRILHEFMDAERVIDLDAVSHPQNVARTDLGHSIGRFESGALLIHTERFAAGALWAGRLNTEALTTTERLWVDEDSGHLILEWTAHDPAYYAAAHHGRRVFVRTNIDLEPFDCRPQIGHRRTE